MFVSVIITIVMTAVHWGLLIMAWALTSPAMNVYLHVPWALLSRAMHESYTYVKKVILHVHGTGRQWIWLVHGTWRIACLCREHCLHAPWALPSRKVKSSMACCQTESPGVRLSQHEPHQTNSGPPESRNRFHSKYRAFQCLPPLMWKGRVLQSIPGALIMWLPCSTSPRCLNTSKHKLNQCSAFRALHQARQAVCLAS